VGTISYLDQWPRTHSHWRWTESQRQCPRTQCFLPGGRGLLGFWGRAGGLGGRGLRGRLMAIETLLLPVFSDRGQSEGDQTMASRKR